MDEREPPLFRLGEVFSFLAVFAAAGLVWGIVEAVSTLFAGENFVPYGLRLASALGVLAIPPALLGAGLAGAMLAAGAALFALRSIFRPRTSALLDAAVLSFLAVVLAHLLIACARLLVHHRLGTPIGAAVVASAVLAVGSLYVPLARLGVRRSVSAPAVLWTWLAALVVFAALGSRHVLGLLLATRGEVHASTWASVLGRLLVGLAAAGLAGALAGIASLRLLGRSPSRNASALLLALAAAWGGLAAHLAVLSRAGEPPRTPAPQAAPEPAGARPYRLVVLEVDGADWKEIDPLVRAGELPNLSRMISQGARASLQTIFPTFSPLIWTSIVTGRTPIEHGILDARVKRFPGLDPLVTSWLTTWSAPDWTQKLFGLYERTGVLDHPLVTSRAWRARALWEIFDAHERDSVVVAHLVTWPAPEVRGAVVSDRFWNAIEKGRELPGLAHPAETWGEVKGLALAEGESDAEVLRAGFEPGSAAAAQFRRDETAVRMFLRLFGERQPDLGVLYVKGVDEIGHHVAWTRYGSHLLGAGGEASTDTLAAYYRYVDSVLGRVEAAAGGGVVFAIVSDHGHVLHKSQHMYAPPGILVLAGEPIRREVALDRATIYDVAPTLVALAGMAVARDMRGRPLDAAIAPDFLSVHPIRSIESYDPEPRRPVLDTRDPLERDVIESLRALGYAQ